MSSETSVLPQRDSAKPSGGSTSDYCIDPADLNVPEHSAPSASTKRISVLPAVNLYNGTVGFALPRGWVEYFHPEPWRIEEALRQAVKPAQWSPYLEVLTITVASNENRAGDPVHFSLLPLTQGQAG